MTFDCYNTNDIGISCPAYPGQHKKNVNTCIWNTKNNSFLRTMMIMGSRSVPKNNNELKIKTPSVISARHSLYGGHKTQFF